MLEHIGILSFRNPPGSSALLHLHQNIRQKMLGFVDLHFELVLFCFVQPSYTANSSASFATFAIALPEVVPNTNQHWQEYKWVCQICQH